MIKIELKSKNENSYWFSVIINGKPCYDSRQNMSTEMRHLELLFSALDIKVEFIYA